MINRSDRDISQDEDFMCFVKLANDRRFYMEMLDTFPLKNERKDTMHWKAKIINEDVKDRKKRTQPKRKNYYLPYSLLIPVL